ncbi:hypothetical protein UNDKW_1626 [Undibacterium sp. KW1]|nr:hypothetical protein UNDKW_1626 [Undibacterium sp. KW1]
MLDPDTPESWPPRIRLRAYQFFRDGRTNKNSAKRLVELGLAVYMKDGRCVLKLATNDGLSRWIKSKGIARK